MRTHIHFMERCIELGKEAMLCGNPPVGSILVKDDVILGIGKEAGKSGNDITKHAEIEAIRHALANHQSLKNSILYTTHEPCIMCSYVLDIIKLKPLYLDQNLNTLVVQLLSLRS